MITQLDKIKTSASKITNINLLSAKQNKCKQRNKYFPHKRGSIDQLPMQEFLGGAERPWPFITLNIFFLLMPPRIYKVYVSSTALPKTMTCPTTVPGKQWRDLLEVIIEILKSAVTVCHIEGERSKYPIVVF